MTIILTDDQAEKVREALNVAVAVLYKVAYEESKIGIEAECAGSFVPEALAILDGAQRVEPLSDDVLMSAYCITPGIHQFVTAFKAGARFVESHNRLKKEF